MVGVIRFERTTSPSRTVRATELRHTPTWYIVYSRRNIMHPEVTLRLPRSAGHDLQVSPGHMPSLLVPQD